jgi:DNA invertase Pin-like site-specific DNA recombinase
MTQGRHTTLTIRLTAHERQTLERWQRSTTIPAKRARRGRILLLLAAQMPVSQIATTVDCTRHSIYKWAQRFLTEGLTGLDDKRRRAASAAPQRALRQGSV